MAYTYILEAVMIIVYFVGFFFMLGYYASSKICSKCGTKKEKLPLSQRVYTCECGNNIDRDINAAINIATEGMSIYLHNLIEAGTPSIA